ncbi:hypothetical protein M513_02416 [Trichuris suis]|uniref:Uncharacterized protein n=1 Tax=Trichuris suis TaxID=68888 RepID=A0A085MHP3_9BILA|nr:hypothetical protein M513_02416 [Trichuris suis]
MPRTNAPINAFIEHPEVRPAETLPRGDSPASYRGPMGEPHGDRFFDVRLIPAFDGAAGQSVIEWFEKLELVCRLRGVEHVACVVPLRLTGGAFAVYMELPDQDKESAVKVKEALLSAFAMIRLLHTTNSLCGNCVLAKLRTCSWPSCENWRPCSVAFPRRSGMCLYRWLTGERPAAPQGRYASRGPPFEPSVSTSSSRAH